MCVAEEHLRRGVSAAARVRVPFARRTPSARPAPRSPRTSRSRQRARGSAASAQGDRAEIALTSWRDPVQIARRSSSRLREHALARACRARHVLVAEPSHLPVAASGARHAAVLELRAREACTRGTDHGRLSLRTGRGEHTSAPTRLRFGARGTGPRPRWSLRGRMGAVTAESQGGTHPPTSFEAVAPEVRACRLQHMRRADRRGLAAARRAHRRERAAAAVSRELVEQRLLVVASRDSWPWGASWSRGGHARLPS